MSDVLRQQIDRVQRLAIIGAVLGCACCVIGAMTSHFHFFIAWLMAWMFWAGLSFGCFLLAMIHNLTGGRWGNMTRRILEAGYMALPVMAFLLAPIYFGLRDLYPWARPEQVALDLILQKKQHYLNTGGFIARTVVCLAIWSSMVWALRKWSLEQDLTADLTPTRRARVLSGAGVVIYPLTGTIFFIDLVLSLEPRWFSTMFPIIIFTGQILWALTFSVLALAWFKQQEPLRDVVSEMSLYQLGNLMLAFVLFWTYVSFSQLLIIYSGNLPQEISWYLHRIAGNWKWLLGGIAFFNFFLPFYALLFKPVKQKMKRLAVVAAIIFVTGPIEVFWYVKPTFFPTGINFHWLDLAAFVGVGGVWMTLFLTGVKRHSLLLRHDPRVKYEKVAHAV